MRIGNTPEMATQHQPRPPTEAWAKISRFPDRPCNIQIGRPEYQTALNIPVSRQAPPQELQRFSVREGDLWIHVYGLFIRATDDHGLQSIHFSKDTRDEIMEAMFQMFVPRSAPLENVIPKDVLKPMLPYKDTESYETVTVITTLSFNSLDGLQHVLVAPVDSDGRVDVLRTRACPKNSLVRVNRPDVQEGDAMRDISTIFLQWHRPTAVNTPCTDDAMLEHEGHLSQQGQIQDSSDAAVLRHFKKTKSSFGTHLRMCALCKEKAVGMFHTTTCREDKCPRCMNVARGLAHHTELCNDPTCPLFTQMCHNAIGIQPFEHDEPTAVFVGVMRLVLTRILRFDCENIADYVMSGP